MEPYEYERQREQRGRAYHQLQSMISLAFNNGHLLKPLLGTNEQNKYNQRCLNTNTKNNDMTWPIRMVHHRHFARKLNHNPKTFDADQMLDMPNLSDDWSML